MTRVVDLHGRGNTRATRELHALAAAGSCWLCNRPRDLDPIRGGCSCIFTDPDRAEVVDAVELLIREHRLLERAERGRRLREGLDRYGWAIGLGIFAALFLALAVL